MEQFNRLIDKLRLLPIAHIDKVSTPSDINTIELKVKKFKELILYINLLSTSGYKLVPPKVDDVRNQDETNWFFQQFKTVEKKLNEEILTYNREGNVMVVIIFEFVIRNSPPYTLMHVLRKVSFHIYFTYQHITNIIFKIFCSIVILDIFLT